MELDRLRRNIARHIALSDSEFLHFASLVQRRRLQRRDRLLVPGEVCRFEGFVDAGCLRVYCTDPGGSDHILYFAPEDWWFADIQSFVSESPADLGIDALEPTEALLIDRASKERLYIEVPKFERLFRIMTQRALVALERRMIGAMAKSAEERYFDFKRRYPTLEDRIPQYHIAAYLGVRPECLSRMRRQITARES
jgi:CRP-like cAMP-binding protein